METYSGPHKHEDHQHGTSDLRNDYSTSEVVVNSGSQSHAYHNPLTITPESVMNRLNSSTSTSDTTIDPMLLTNTTTTGGISQLENWNDTSSAVDEMSMEEFVCHNYGISLDALHNIHDDTSGPNVGSDDKSGINVNATLSSSTILSTTYGNSSDSFPTGVSSSGINLDAFGSPFHHENISVCQRNWDGILCWPETTIGHTATLACFPELNGISYDSSHNATRFCDEVGIWNTTNYDFCKPVNPETDDNNLLAITTGVYFVGYCLSLAALMMAFCIFLAFKELRCLRNTIHTHLIITYILADTLWIITSSTTFSSAPEVHIPIQPVKGQSPGSHVSCVTFILLHYFHLTNFFWMFVEGLYLYVLVVQTFVAENIKLRVYVSIGWGLPLSVVIGWALVKWLTQPSLADSQAADPDFDVSTCLWLSLSNYDWIYKSPAILILIANILFLLQVMWVLITKLRSATNPETQQSVKAAKALVVLMPLLGITYLLVLSGSREPIYEFIRALLISTQGFLVALLYCFLNGEVRVALRHRWNRLRTMGPEFSCCVLDRRRQMQQMRDWSPRSRTESIRLYNPAIATHSFRKRESSASEATTMTTLHGSLNNGTVGPLGMGHRLSTTYLPTSQKFYNNVDSNLESNNTFI